MSFRTADGIRVYADVYEAKAGKRAPLLLLFHQGDGDARGEYGAIVPRLRERGYNVIAVDQRSGGAYFGGQNRTVAELKGREFAFCDAYPDLEAALRYAKEHGFNGRRLAWGSSYSATLALRLAVEHRRNLAGGANPRD